MWNGVFAAAIILSSLTLLVTGCTREEVPKEWSKLQDKARGQGSISLYVFKYEDYFRVAATSFEEETGIHVKVVLGTGEGTYQKVEAEKEGRGTVDLWLLSGPQVQPAVLHFHGLKPGDRVEMIADGEVVVRTLPKDRSGDFVDPAAS